MFTFVAALLIGLAVGSILLKYWENIRTWLNTTAADAVERVLGYKARQAMFKAVSVADKVFRVLNNRRVATNLSTVFTKQTDNTYKKVTMLNHTAAESLGQAYLDEMKTANNVMQLDYKQ